MTNGDSGVIPTDAQGLAAALRDLLEAANRELDANSASPLVARLTDHLGIELADIIPVSVVLSGWEHATLQRAVDAYLTAHTPGAAWFGVAGVGRQREDTLSMAVGARRHGVYELGAVDLTAAGVGRPTTRSRWCATASSRPGRRTARPSWSG